MAADGPQHVAIVGAGRSHGHYTVATLQASAPHGGFDEVWAINSAGALLKCDLWFAADNMPDLIERRQGDAYQRALEASTVPIMTTLPDDRIPMSRAMPCADIANAVGYGYFNTSAAWALGYALLNRVPNLHLFGLDFSYEPQVQGDPEKMDAAALVETIKGFGTTTHMAEKGRACVEFLCGVLMERGVRIHVASGSTLLDQSTKQPPYGFPEGTRLKRQANGLWMLEMNHGEHGHDPDHQ